MEVEKLQLFPNGIQQLLQIKLAFICRLEEPVKVNTVEHPQTPPQLLHLPSQHLRSSLRLEVPTNEPSVESLHKIILVEVVKDKCVKGVAQENDEPKNLQQYERDLKRGQC